jgi:hypothetical protein
MAMFNPVHKFDIRPSEWGAENGGIGQCLWIETLYSSTSGRLAYCVGNEDLLFVLEI